VDTREDADRDMASFDEWTNNCGIQRADGIGLNSEDGMDWFLQTQGPLQEGQPIMAVPSEMILSSQRIRQEFGGAVEAAVDYLGRLGAGDQVPEFYLFVKVLVEYEQGDESPYFPWLNAMPRLYFNSVSMTTFCYECLPPLVYRLSRAERVNFENFWTALKKVDILSPRTIDDQDLAKWAFNVVHTRYVKEENSGDLRIVPMVDMFNHATDTEVDVSYDEEGNCNVYATRDVPEGSPLRISYGNPTNPSIFFARYGFLDESSPATFCKMVGIQATEELTNLGCDPSRMLFYKDTGGISEEVWDVTLYNLLAPDMANQQAFYQAHMNGDEDTKIAYHQHYMPETSKFIQNHVDTFLTTLEELTGRAAGKSLDEHPRLPLILNHNAFVKETFLRVKANIDPMVAQATGEY